MKTILSACFIVFVFSAPMSLFVTKYPDIIDSEKRSLTQFPNIELLYNLKVKRFIEGFEQYYNDRVYFRPYLIDFSSYIYSFFGANIDMNKSFRGKNNWLFLGNDFDNCVSALTGEWKMTESQLLSKLYFFSQVKSIAESYGANFYILVGPNKSSVYPEYLPSIIFPSKQRALSPLLFMLREHNVNVFDPTDNLKQKKNEGLLYFRTDTHWNYLGTKIAFEAFLDEFHIGEFPDVKLIPSKEYIGDLISIGGYKNFPLELGDNFIPQLTEEKKVDHKTILVLGDSFSESLMFYLGAMFKKVYFKKYRDIAISKSDLPQLAEYIKSLGKVDIVLWIQVERIFIYWDP